MEGYTIIFDDEARKVIEMPSHDSKIILKGPTGSGKSTILLERYKYMVDKLKIPSEKILILLLNRTQSLEWRTKTVLEGSGAVLRTSYYGFIQNEIKTFYPIITKKCNEIVNRDIKPVFLTFEAAQFLVSTVIEWRRKNLGVFAGVTSYTDRLAIDITGNLVRAAISDIPYNRIGDRLYNALENKDELRRQIYREADDIVADYRKKCLELGIFDFGMAVELYNNYLLKDEVYRNNLFSRIEHLIVDNIEECVPTEVDFINFLLPNLKTCLLAYNQEGGYGEAFGGNHEYVKSVLIDKMEKIEIKKSHTCHEFLAEFSDMLFENIKNLKNNKCNPGPYIERVPPFELRSEMLENVGERIVQLISREGYKPSDIVVISSYADPVTEFVIGRILERYGYEVKNLARKSRIIDNPFSQALITLAQLCHPGYGSMPTKDDVKSLLRMVLKIDPVRSSILAGEIVSQRPFAEFPDIEFPGLVERVGYYNIEKYEYIRNWIKEYKMRPMPLKIDEFFQKVFLEILISKEVSQKDILEAKNLIDSAQTFVEVVSRFNRNASRDFLEVVRRGIKSAESIFELEEKLSGEFVLMSTPVSYLACSLKSKVTIITSISSNNWTPRSVKEITNLHVLTKTWNENDIYTEELEEKNQKHYLATLMRAIFKRCSDKIITFESMLSANGYENDGILAEYFDEIMSQ
ncbi:UvrD-helicase domain-containing protein [Acetivibrio clariflavus]|uniref:UvrD-helicase domain-containing protein n=1 Tax=Acetivibrio clariflavus TaxID=288965 RepID=UPI00119B0DEA